MKHEREAAAMTVSPWAATILPGSARPAKKTRQAADAEPPAPVVSPGQPPPAYLPTDLHRHARPVRGTNRRWRIVASAIALALALGAAAYVELPKLRGAKTSTGPATIAFPLAIDSFTRSAPTADRGLATLSALKGDTPALTAAHLVTYGAKPNIVVLAGLLPTTMRGSNPAHQLALAATVNATAREQLLGPGRLALIAQSNGNASLQCSFTTAVLSNTSRTGCVWVDGEAIVVTSVVDPSETAGIAATKRVIAGVERH